MPDLYSVLGLPRRAKSEEIKAAYWTLAKQSHPDVMGGSKQAEQRIKEINRAYEILGDPATRAAYDLYLRRLRTKARRRFWSAAVTATATFALTLGASSVIVLWRQHAAIQQAGSAEPARVGSSTSSEDLPKPRIDNRAELRAQPLAGSDAPVPSASGEAPRTVSSEIASGPQAETTMRNSGFDIDRDGSRVARPDIAFNRPPVELSDAKPRGDRVIVDCDKIEVGEATLLGPGDANSYHGRGLAWYAKGDLDRAIACFNQAILIDPTNARAYIERGNAWDDNGDHDRALEDYNQALHVEPKNAVAFYNRAIMWWRKGALDRALPDFDQAIRGSFGNANFYNGRGLAWHGRGQYYRAIADFNRALKIDPSFADAYYNRGLAWIGNNDIERAIADYTKAIDLGLNHTLAFSNRGWAHHLAGRERNALADIAKAIALDPKAVNAFLRRARVYEKLGERDKSVVDFATAADLELEMAAPARGLKHVVSAAEKLN